MWYLPSLCSWVTLRPCGWKYISKFGWIYHLWSGKKNLAGESYFAARIFKKEMENFLTWYYWHTLSNIHIITTRIIILHHTLLTWVPCFLTYLTAALSEKQVTKQHNVTFISTVTLLSSYYVVYTSLMPILWNFQWRQYTLSIHKVVIAHFLHISGPSSLYW